MKSQTSVPDSALPEEEQISLEEIEKRLKQLIKDVGPLGGYFVENFFLKLKEPIYINMKQDDILNNEGVLDSINETFKEFLVNDEKVVTSLKMNSLTIESYDIKYIYSYILSHLRKFKNGITAIEFFEDDERAAIVHFKDKVFLLFKNKPEFKQDVIKYLEKIRKGDYIPSIDGIMTTRHTERFHYKGVQFTKKELGTLIYQVYLEFKRSEA